MRSRSFYPTVNPAYGTTTATPYSTGNTVTFELIENDGTSGSRSLSCSFSGSVTSCSAPPSVWLPAYGTAYVTVSFNTGTGGTGTVELVADYNFNSPGQYNVLVQGMTFPVITDASENGTFRDVSRCVADCFENVHTYSTPAYISMDTPRSMTLVYRSGQAHPLGTVRLSVVDPSTPPADSFKLELKNASNAPVTFTNNSTAIYYRGGVANDTTHMIAQFDASGLGTGAYLYTALVTSLWHDGTTAQSSASIRIIVLDETASRFGRGWTIAGLQHAYVGGDGVLVTDGSGSASFFSGTCAPGATCTFGSPSGDFSTFKHDAGGYHRTYPNGTVVNFADAGTESSEVDRFGNTTSYTWSSGLLTAIQDPAGQNVSLAYTSNPISGQLLHSVTTPGGRVSTFNMTDPDLTSIVDPDGVSFGYFDYDANHMLSHFRDRRGGDWNFAYTAGKSVLDTVQAPQVHASGQDLRPTDVLSGPWAQLVAAIAGGAGTASNPVARGIDVRATVKDPRGYTTTYALNKWGSPVTVLTPDPSVSYSYGYNATTGQITSFLGPAGHSVTYTWTGANLTTVADNSTGQSVNVHYEPTYNQVDSISGNAVVTEKMYFDANRTGKPQVSVREGPSTAPLTLDSIDSRGRLARVTDIGGHIFTAYFSSTGFQNTDSVVTPGDRVTAYRYDAYGRPVSVTSPGTGTKDSVEYDLVNRQTASVDGENRRTAFHYDSLFLRAVVDPMGQADSLVRNALGWTTAEWRPGSTAAIQATYDAAGNVLTSTNRRGQVVSLAYDALGRMTLRQAVDDTAHFNYAVYSSPSGGIAGYVAASNGEGTDTVFLDIQGRVKRTNTGRAGSWYMLDYTYNPNGTLGHRDATSGQWICCKTVSYGYNSVEALDTLVVTNELGSQQTVLNLNNENLTESLTYPNGLVNTITTTTNHEHYQSTFAGPGSVDARLGVLLALDTDGRIAQRRRSLDDSLKMYLYDPDHRFRYRQIYQDVQQPSCQPVSTDFGYDCPTIEPLDHTET